MAMIGAGPMPLGTCTAAQIWAESDPINGITDIFTASSFNNVSARQVFARVVKIGAVATINNPSALLSLTLLDFAASAIPRVVQTGEDTE
jgi:hypothetical protein